MKKYLIFTLLNCIVALTLNAQSFDKEYLICRLLIDDSLYEEINIVNSKWINSNHSIKFKFDTVKVSYIKKEVCSTTTLTELDSSTNIITDNNIIVSDKEDNDYGVYKMLLFELNDKLSEYNIETELYESNCDLRIESHLWKSIGNCINSEQKRILNRHFICIKKQSGFWANKEALALQVIFISKNDEKRSMPVRINIYKHKK